MDLEKVIDHALNNMANEESRMKRPTPNMPKEMLEPSIP